MLSSIAKSGRGFRHLLSWDTWNTLCTPDNLDGSSTRYARGPYFSRIGYGPMLPFNPKTMYTFHRRDSKVYMVANLKLQGMMSLIGVALLTGLSSQYVGSDLSHLLFSFCHNVEAKNNSFTGFRPAQRCMVGPSIECLKR
jgi:hypothetical protein